jgi:maltooligosyltrehalose trehalohydrolase
MTTALTWRRLPIGAEIRPGGYVHFRVWAPKRNKVYVRIQEGSAKRTGKEHRFELSSEDNGYFSGLVENCGAGTLYMFQLDEDHKLYPDPASRFQPNGPDGPSQVIDPSAFMWSDQAWPGVKLEGQVLYEMHVGTFTSDGTFSGAAKELDRLADVGITTIELMPIADFMGSFGWGYDGVNLFAPTRLYGQPDNVREFVDMAHGLGLGVILDVVYNHLGPAGSHLTDFSDSYFSERHKTDWGRAINYDGKNSASVREFFCSNASYWISEYHFDGLRLDATTEIFDDSQEHILTCMSLQSRKAAGNREIILIAENEAQNVKLVKAVEQGGYGMDAVWNDDFHHTAMTALRGRKEAYYTDYWGSPQEFISCVKWGYLYQGQRYQWQKKRRGSPTFGLKPSAFVTFLENHDQVANSARGKRSHRLGSPGVYRALTALTLLSPGTPMLFQGQEFGSSKPFFYFADHKADLARQVLNGRKEFLSQFPSIADPAVQNLIPEPSDPTTFQQCVLDSSESIANEAIHLLHRDLLSLRKKEPAFRAQCTGCVEGAVLGPQAFVLRFLPQEGSDAVLIVNLGIDLRLTSAPEPLLAPPENRIWEIVWSSENPRYGGSGTPPVETDEYWLIPGHAAVVLMPREGKDPKQYA